MVAPGTKVPFCESYLIISMVGLQVSVNTNCAFSPGLICTMRSGINKITTGRCQLFHRVGTRLQPEKVDLTVLIGDKLVLIRAADSGFLAGTDG